jgi:phosphate transport system protein
MLPRTHYARQLEAIYKELRSLGQMVMTAVAQALDALQQEDAEVARRVVADDRRIDHAQYALEEHAIAIIATQQPVASDLRLLIAAIEVAGELERIGDYAKGIAKIVIRDVGQPFVDMPIALTRMTEQALAMLDNALDAFFRQDATAAWQLQAADNRVDELMQAVQTELLAGIQREPMATYRAVDLLIVAHNLERIADRTTNIAERIIYLVRGVTVELNPGAEAAEAAACAISSM